MPETTLEEKTYTPESDETAKFYTTSEGSILSHISGMVDADYTHANDIVTYTELSDYSRQSRESIMRGLNQSKTQSMGSFKEYID